MKMLLWSSKSVILDLFMSIGDIANLVIIETLRKVDHYKTQAII